MSGNRGAEREEDDDDEEFSDADLGEDFGDVGEPGGEERAEDLETKLD